MVFFSKAHSIFILFFIKKKAYNNFKVLISNPIESPLFLSHTHSYTTIVAISPSPPSAIPIITIFTSPCTTTTSLPPHELLQKRIICQDPWASNIFFKMGFFIQNFELLPVLSKFGLSLTRIKMFSAMMEISRWSVVDDWWAMGRWYRWWR